MTTLTNNDELVCRRLAQDITESDEDGREKLLKIHRDSLRRLRKQIPQLEAELDSAHRTIAMRERALELAGETE